MKLMGIVSSMSYEMYCDEDTILFVEKGKRKLTCSYKLFDDSILLTDVVHNINRGGVNILVTEALTRFGVNSVKCHIPINNPLLKRDNDLYTFKEGMRERISDIYKELQQNSDLYVTPYNYRRPYLDFKLYGYPYYMQNSEYLTIFHLEQLREVLEINSTNRVAIFGDLTDDEIQSMIDNTEFIHAYFNKEI